MRKIVLLLLLAGSALAQTPDLRAPLIKRATSAAWDLQDAANVHAVAIGFTLVGLGCIEYNILTDSLTADSRKQLNVIGFGLIGLGTIMDIFTWHSIFKAGDKLAIRTRSNGIAIALKF